MLFFVLTCVSTSSPPGILLSRGLPRSPKRLPRSPPGDPKQPTLAQGKSHRGQAMTSLCPSLRTPQGDSVRLWDSLDKGPKRVPRRAWEGAGGAQRARQERSWNLPRPSGPRLGPSPGPSSKAVGPRGLPQKLWANGPGAFLKSNGQKAPEGPGPMEREAEHMSAPLGPPWAHLGHR